MSNKINNQEIAETMANNPSFLTDLIYCEDYDCFYLWDKYYFRLLDGFRLKKTCHMFIAKEYPKINITDSLVLDIIKSLKYYVNIVRNEPDLSRVAFIDRNFNLDTFDFEPHSKQNLTIFNFPFDSQDIYSPTPVWENFLKTSLVKRNTNIPDQELIDFIQEMFGYFLLPSLKGSSAFFLVGDGSNGKSVMVKVLEQMFGSEYCSSMSIQKLTTSNWASAHLIGKKINISNEEESKFMRADTFKALITGDTITGERKFGDNFEFKPNTKFIFATNEMPTFDTMNYGLKRRMKFIPFFRRFLDHEQDKDLQDKLSKEMPGIIGWSIVGAKKFIENNRTFNQATASIEKLESFVQEISTALTFFDQMYIIDDSCKSATCDVYEHYRRWCDDNGYKFKNIHNFWKDINKEYGDKLIDLWTKSKDPDKTKQVRGKNIGLKDDFLSELVPDVAEISVETLPF
jgi:P4 family phage/plasmid primase-like protien